MSGLPAGVLGSAVPASAKRIALRVRMASGALTVLPGAFSPLVARMIADHGFAGVYVSGHMLAADLALPDLGLTTAPEVAARAGAIARATDLPTVVDADTGFGSLLSLARTVQLLEDAGLAGCHLEDQADPKRPGGGSEVRLVSPVEAEARIRQAVAARRDDSFVLIARTDALGVEGLEAAIERGRRLEGAGADALFVEGLSTPAEIERVRAAIAVPLVVNVNELGASGRLSAGQLESLGVAVSLHPLALLRLALQPVDEALSGLAAVGTLTDRSDRMHPPTELARLLRTEGYDEPRR